jgi:circadian clock protein KaiC
MASEPIIAESFDEISLEQEDKENDEYSQISEIEPINKQDHTSQKRKKREWMLTGIAGFDELLEKGIPTGSNVIIAGGPGCGKTIFCSQVIYNKALEGKDCVFLSMEERPDRLRNHMREFGFKVTEIETSQEQIILRADGKGRIALKRLQPIRLARSIEALLEKASGTLPVDIDLVLDFIPKDFDPYLLVLDSLSAIETAFSGTKRQYRIYIEQLFRYFEELDITTFMITESSDAPHKFSSTGVEEFLADGIFVFYNFPGVKKRTRGIEIYKLRGAPHSQKIMSLNITNAGIEIVSDQSGK